MRLPFLDRDEETARLTRLLESSEGSPHRRRPPQQVLAGLR
jgi:hypothetical protein